MACPPVVLTLQDLQTDSVDHDALERAFGPSGLGILIVEGIGNDFESARQSVLRYATSLAHLPDSELGMFSPGSMSGLC